MTSKPIPLLKVHPPPHTRLIEETLDGGFYTEGPKVAEFERRLIPYVANPYAVALNSTTAALYLALYLTGVRPGKAVITTPMTSPATNISIHHLGGQILWADVDPNSGNISPASVERLMDRYEDRVAAVVAVDWGGMPCDYDALREAIRDRAYLIEDAAHALGAEYKGQLTGALADFTCFSFQAVKHITTGDGGLLTCGNKHAWQRARRLRWHGIDSAKSNRAYDEDVLEAGFNFQMNDIAASMGITQLEDLSEILTRRRQIASRYEDELAGIRFQTTDYDCLPAYLLFSLIVEDRTALQTKLNANGIAASPVFCRNDTYSGFQRCTLGKDDLVHTTAFAERVLCIPVGEWLDDTEVQRIIDCVKGD